MKKFTKGFTLIELLIVIALLGALAVALLAALDPLEQIRKGTDTGVRNTVAEIAGSITRYASVKSGAMPYAGTLAWGSVGTSITPKSPAYTVIENVISAGELKQDFFALASAQLQKIFIVADQERAYVCFLPEAKSFRVDNNTKFMTVAGGLATMDDTLCTNGTVAGGAQCYWCMR